ncbi:MAG: hypothetical protein K2N78_08650, partial [Oscillospiraceae bacterium]|nr:hypothetical protein [Oscillospiraceae bacterium]
IQSSEEYQYESDVYRKLCEAEIQAAKTTERLSHEEVMAAARAKLGLNPLPPKKVTQLFF